MSTSYSLSGSNAGNGPGGRAFPDEKLSYEFSLRTAEITSSIETAACRHETTPGQWRVLARVNCSAFWGAGETRSCPEITHIQLFRHVLGGRRDHIRHICHISPRVQSAGPSSLWNEVGL